MCCYCEIVGFPPKLQRFLGAGHAQLLISGRLWYENKEEFWRKTYYFKIIAQFSYRLSYISWTLVTTLKAPISSVERNFCTLYRIWGKVGDSAFFMECINKANDVSEQRAIFFSRILILKYSGFYLSNTNLSFKTCSVIHNIYIRMFSPSIHSSSISFSRGKKNR